MKTINLIIVAGFVFGIFCFVCAACMVFWNMQFPILFVNVVFYSFVLFYFAIAIWFIVFIYKMFKEDIKKKREKDEYISR